MIHYSSAINTGLSEANSNGDGYSINLVWNRAYTDDSSLRVGYNIYMSTEEKTLYSDGIKFVCLDDVDNVDILDLTPGQVYYFAVRAVEFNPSLFELNLIPRVFNNLVIPSESYLASNLTYSGNSIHLVDSEDFPQVGIVKVGAELINYNSNSANVLGINSTIIQRGFYGTKVSFHNTDGYDGISKLDSRVSLYFGLEEMNNVFYSVQNRFEFDNDAFTEADGYHQVIKDTLTTDLSFSDAQNIGFNSYDFAGWHRTSPVDLLSGACVGSYIGGEQHCADGYGGVGMMVRGMNLQEKNNQRQEVLLSVTGEPVCLIKRVHTGITCSCYQPSSEYADERCPYCLGTKFKLGYEQYFNPRRSDGRLMVSFGNADEDLKMTEAGLESEFMPECWTLTVPTIKDRDIIVRFNRDGTEDEFRYEVLSVSRNRTVLDQQGAQKFKIQRVRKFDPIYKIRSMFRRQ
jgi:hypothetical protein